MDEEICYINGMPYKILRRQHGNKPYVRDVKAKPVANGKQEGTHFFTNSGELVHAHLDSYENQKEKNMNYTYPISGTVGSVAVSATPIYVNTSGNVRLVVAPGPNYHFAHINTRPTIGSTEITANCSGYMACAIFLDNQ